MANKPNKSGDIEKRIAAAQTLREDAEAVHNQLIDELTAKRRGIAEQHEKLGKELKELDAKIVSLAYNLSCLRGEVYDEPHKNVQSKRHHIKDEVILAFLVENRSSATSDVQNYFKFSSATVCRRMDALLSAGKVTVEKRGTMKIWKAKS